MTKNNPFITTLENLFKKYDKPFSQSSQTVVCALDSVINDDVIMKNIKMSKLKNTIYINDDKINLSHYNEYSINNNFRETLQTIIQWSSDLKFLSSFFNNYLWKRIFDDKLELPEINDTFFTQLFNTVAGKKNAKFEQIFNDFSKIHKVGHYIPWISCTAQVICHMKNEMTTSFKNNIILNFENRTKSMLRWRLLNSIDERSTISYTLLKEYLFKVCNSVYQSLINQDNVKVDVINKKYIKTNISSKLFKNNKLEQIIKRDRELFDIILTPNLESRYIKSKIRDNKEIPKKYIFSTALKNNCAQCLMYLYEIQNIIQDLQLTTEYNYAIEQTNLIPKENKEEIMICWKQHWKFGKTRLPKFKLSCYNKVKQHFIRIDQKTLKEWEIDIRDKNSWWLSSIVNVYNKSANIRELQREKFLRTPNSVLSYVETADFSNKKEYCPWIPGSSFLTDGIQFQLPLLTIRPRETRGLDKLFNRGYTGFKQVEDSQSPININEIKKGIYCLGKDNILLNKEDLKNYNFLAVDPGRKRPMSTTIIKGEEIPYDWNDHQRAVIIDKSMDSNKYITNKEYYDLCGMTKRNQFELQRRQKNVEYNESINNLSNYDSKNIFSTDYTQEKLKYWNTERKELFMKYRLKLKFKTYSLTQSGLSQCCKNITHNFKKECIENGKLPVILFGNGSFSPGGSGYASVPRKPVIRNLATQFSIFITDEFNTSKKCPIIFKDIEDEKNQKKTNSSGDRLRKCATVNEDTAVSFDTEDNENNSETQERDRDSIGSVNIGQKGIYTILHNPISHFERKS